MSIFKFLGDLLYVAVIQTSEIGNRESQANIVVSVAQLSCASQARRLPCDVCFD
jgi:hypothetical protein